MPPSPLIEARNISYARGGKTILDNVSLGLGAGDFITIIGPNGAGKTTLLKLIAGIHAPDSGAVVRAGNIKIGYIPQRVNMETSRTMPMTAGRFLALGGGGADTHAAHADETGIAGILDTPLAALSGGEWQRLLLARALKGDPDVIILDEPAQNLDVAGQLAFYALLDSIHGKRGIAILMVSHDLHMVMASTRQVICLYHHVCCSGKPDAVTRHPEFAKLFGKDMAKLMTVYRHSHDHEHGHEH